MVCYKCGSSNIKVTVPVIISGDSSLEGNISKKSINHKSTTIDGAKWECLTRVCLDCHSTDGGYGNYVSRCTQVLEEIVKEADNYLDRNPNIQLKEENMTENDIEILLEYLFAKHTDYGKVPTNQAQLLNKFDDEELAVVLCQLMYAVGIIKDPNEDFI